MATHSIRQEEAAVMAKSKLGHLKLANLWSTKQIVKASYQMKEKSDLLRQFRMIQKPAKRTSHCSQRVKLRSIRSLPIGSHIIHFIIDLTMHRFV